MSQNTSEKCNVFKAAGLVKSLQVLITNPGTVEEFFGNIKIKLIER